MAQEYLSCPPSLVKLWAAMPNQDRRWRNMNELHDLVDKEGNFNFFELFNRYGIGYTNPISVELPGK